MNKFFKGAIVIGVGCTMLATTALTACGGQALDTEKRPLMLSIGSVDDNYNPFFYSALNDGELVSMTQISMLTIDSDGDIACGDDWPTVVQDYKYTMYNTKEVGSGTPTGVVTSEGQTGTGSMDGRTEYEFLIKDGIKFSDGQPLTIKDVLFNLYVYLDYAYTGSSTMYSTDIQGLKAYRSQTPGLADDGSTDFDSRFRELAQDRITNLLNWSNGRVDTYDADDLAVVDELFKEEINSDWNALSTSWSETFKHAYRFEEVWQAYLFQEGIIEVQTKLNDYGATVEIFEDKNGNGKRDDDVNNSDNSEKYYTTLDPNQKGSQQGAEGTVSAARIIEEVEAAATPEKIADYIANHNEDGVTITEQMAKEALWKEACLKIVKRQYLTKGTDGYTNVLSYWATGSKVLERFIGDESTKYFKTHQGVKSIKGITTYKTDTFNGQKLGGEYDVLKIVINGIDPKAIFNFAFAVTPLHYYSGSWTNSETGVTTNYVTEFNGVDNFGVAVGDSDFFRDVLGAPEKNSLPVGAGAYKATNFNGEDNITGGFKSGDNIFRYKRNEYFHTTGKNIQNAKIKFVNYKVYNDDKIMEALSKGEIDYGMPNASLSNFNLISQSQNSHLAKENYRTGGYGYVGINPKKVPEYPIRLAIMKAMNVNKALAMYGTQLAEGINRPMSSTSWAYPRGIGPHETIGEYQADEALLKAELEELVAKAGYTKGPDGILMKDEQKEGMANAADDTKLDIKFTIAGESVADHPAYAMFLDAKEILESVGFKITVSADSRALKMLANGELAVWAAAWSSSVDPDMYQIYHKDSKATSVKNWNYPNILQDQSTWSYEFDIIDELSDKIDEARTVLGKEQRKTIYGECLDLVMELAVEFPVYQRDDLCVYNKNVIAANSLVKNPNHNLGLFGKIWEINYV
ncbi:MAG: hypothetical protein K2L67_05265 [Clostridia bacterium]|nr:hypothetical protein [Clostridia bacterium]